MPDKEELLQAPETDVPADMPSSANGGEPENDADRQQAAYEGNTDGTRPEPAPPELSRESRLEAEVASLSLQLAEVREQYDALYDLVLGALPATAFAAMLRREDDPGHWFEFLRYATQNYLVVLAVRDTPGSSMPLSILRKILGAGFTLFRTDLWRTYIGVISQGRVVHQDFHENEIRTDYSYRSIDSNFWIHATSQAWRQGNKADISINTKRNMSAGLRGVNIVIYDVSSRLLLDSIGFDAHEIDAIRFVHKKLGELK